MIVSFAQFVREVFISKIGVSSGYIIPLLSSFVGYFSPRCAYFSLHKKLAPRVWWKRELILRKYPYSKCQKLTFKPTTTPVAKNAHQWCRINCLKKSERNLRIDGLA
jgi:hypothetical protein